MTVQKQMIVSDASPLILFARINRLSLIFDLFGKPVFVESSVKREVIAAGIAEGFADAILLSKELERGGIECRTAHKRFSFTGLHEGEAGTIMLCIELGCKQALIDEPAGRSAAKAHGITPHGSLYVLWESAKRGKISKKEAIETLNDLLDAGYYLSTRHYSKFLEKIRGLKQK